jgi:hypothetical protein
MGPPLLTAAVTTRAKEDAARSKRAALTYNASAASRAAGELAKLARAAATAGSGGGGTGEEEVPARPWKVSEAVRMST